MPGEIDPPTTWKQLEWLVEFADEHTLRDCFIRDVQIALDCRHPFGAFKDVMCDCGILDDWYHYREDCYRAPDGIYH